MINRFEETNLKGNPCDTNCVGGFSRLYKQIVDLKEKNSDIVLLNAGDNFQGTIWYNIHNWTVVSHFLNKLPFEAMVSVHYNLKFSLYSVCSLK